MKFKQEKDASAKQGKEADTKKDQEIKKLQTNVDSLTKKAQEAEKELHTAQTALKTQEQEVAKNKSNYG